MGNGPPPEGPAMRRSMETRCCAALDRDPAVTFLGIAAETIATKQSSDCREDCLPLLRHALSGDRVNPDRPVNFLQHLEAAGGGGVASEHAKGSLESKAEIAVLRQQQSALFPARHVVMFR